MSFKDNDGTTSGIDFGDTYGIWGDSKSQNGVLGTSSDGTGVYGYSENGNGITGEGNSGPGVYGSSTTTGVKGVGGIGVYGSCEDRLAIGVGVYGAAIGEGLGVIGDSESGVGVQGQSHDGPGVMGESATDSGVIGLSSSDRSFTDAGVYGSAHRAPGVMGCSMNYVGVVGISDHGGGMAGFGEPVGVQGSSSKGHGVIGIGFKGAGVYAHNENYPGNDAYLALPSLAGGFIGDVYVAGFLKKSGGGFEIDHPLDPANKLLGHAFVESPDMKNIYDGLIHLNEQGEAVVELPEWFEALNENFRYQLTAIGKPAPNLHIAQEIKQNHFKIAGGPSGTKVSWQVTGSRQDAWAQANPVVVEQEKSAQEQGHYLHPDLFNQPKDKNILQMRHAIPRTEQIVSGHEQLKAIQQKNEEIKGRVRQSKKKVQDVKAGQHELDE